MAAPSSSSEADKEAASNDDGRRGRGPTRVRPDHPRCLASCLSSIEACTDSVAECTDGMDRRQLQRNEAARRSRDERGSIPDPIWKRKGIVPLVFIVLAWVYLVYVWRLCSPAIRQQGSTSSHPVRLASRPTGIGLLVAFNILWLMTLWCYLRVVLTPPGYVNDYADKESMPSPIQSEWMRDNVGGPYLGEEQTQPIPHSQQQQEQAPQAGGSGETTESPAGPHDDDGHPVDPSMPALVGPIGAGMLAASAEDGEHRGQGQRRDYQSTPATFDESSSQTQTIQPPPSAALKPSSAAAPALPVPSQQRQQRSNAPPPVWQGLTPKPVRSPPYPDYAPLARSNRYCHRCRHVKAPRAHHCRHCGRCVMRMDHHCPWVGGCVGARNHKFFWHFLLWVTILEIFTLISAAILFTRGVNGGDRGQYSAWTVDGFVISLFPICGLFILFTSPLLVTHSWLLSINQTTIEHLEVARINRREELSLQSYFSKGGVGFEEETKGKGPWSFEALRGKKRIQKEWEGEWGHLRYEANLWKVEQEAPLGAKGGERYKKQTTRFKDGLLNWRFMMGQQPWQWVLPLGHSASDGRDYPVNPRHGEYGQWRTRREWPEELR